MTITMFDRVVDRLRQVRLPANETLAAAKTSGARPSRPIAGQAPAHQGPFADHHLVGFDVHSVGRFAVRFFGCVLAMVMAGTLILWVFASILGLVSAFEKFMRGIGFAGFHLLSIEFLFALAVLTTAIAAFMVAMTMVAAVLYNVLASRWGGVRIFVSGSTGAVPTGNRAAPRPSGTSARSKTSGSSAVA